MSNMYYIYFLFGLLFAFIPVDLIVGSKVVQVGVLFYYLIGIGLYSYKGVFKISVLFKNKIFVFYLLIIFLTLLSVIRSSNPYTTYIEIIGKFVYLVVFVSFTFTFMNFYSNKLQLSAFFWRVNELPLISFIVLNLILQLLGIRFAKIEKVDVGVSVLLSYFGMNSNRLSFPLTPAINTFATIVGSVFLFNILQLLILKRFSLLRLFVLIIMIIVLLLLDSRVSIFLPILIALFLFFLDFIKKNAYLRYSPLILLLGPIIFWFSLFLLKDIPFLDVLSRGGNELETGNSRFIIWLFCVDEIIIFKFKHIFGYGLFGHYGAGVSPLWASIFVNSFEKPELKTPHNALFSLIFDVGYIGVFVFYAFFKFFLKKLIYLLKAEKYYIMYIGYIVYILLSGITESNLSIYNLVGFYQFIVVCSSFFFWITNNKINYAN